jgi:hypothetical protein
MEKKPNTLKSQCKVSFMIDIFEHLNEENIEGKKHVTASKF